MNDIKDGEGNLPLATRETEPGAEKTWGQDGPQRSHIWTGLFLLVIGGLALAKSFGVFIPDWLFSWQMLLIAIGFTIGFRKGFRDGGWFVPIIIGGAFLVNDYVMLGDLRKHIWPVIIIVLGVAFLFRPKSKRNKFCSPGTPIRSSRTNFNSTPHNEHLEDNVSEDYINSTHIFSGSKKIVLSKNFKGGELVNIFGGCEVDLTQADMTGTAVLDVTAVFGGATLVVPSNWAVQSEAITGFGGISDKRKMAPPTEGPRKLLILKGTLMFGGMDIKSY